MRLTVYTDYALRMLMYLALKDDQLATIAEIANSYDISKNHLMKVAHELGIAGYVETVRGRGGGLRLAKPVKSIGMNAKLMCQYIEFVADRQLVALGNFCRESLQFPKAFRLY